MGLASILKEVTVHAETNKEDYVTLKTRGEGYGFDNRNESSSQHCLNNKSPEQYPGLFSV
jgi:hypothetical protein